jgi:hypothetical protein
MKVNFKAGKLKRTGRVKQWAVSSGAITVLCPQLNFFGNKGI